MNKLEELELKLTWYSKLDAKLDKILNGELQLEDYSEEIYSKLSSIEDEINNLKS